MITDLLYFEFPKTLRAEFTTPTAKSTSPGPETPLCLHTGTLVLAFNETAGDGLLKG